MYVTLTFEYRRGRRRWKRVLELSGDEFLIGRAKGCKVRIPSALVSRRHCRLLVYKGFVLAEDLRSVNGVYVNGKQAHGFVPVRPGDRLEVGPVVFAVDYELSPGARDRLERFDGEVHDVKPVPPFQPPRPAKGKPARGGPPAAAVSDVEVVEEVEELPELEVVEEWEEEDLPFADLVEEPPPRKAPPKKKPRKPGRG
jgi:pSer/pThr/pTyr-binding forkhead associated (FHA) protein